MKAFLFLTNPTNIKSVERCLDKFKNWSNTIINLEEILKEMHLFDEEFSKINKQFTKVKRLKRLYTGFFMGKNRNDFGERNEA